MTNTDYQVIFSLVRERSGLVLGDDKGYLVESRLKSVLRAHALADLRALVVRLRAGDKRLITDVVEALTTNETSFFRDTKPFHSLTETILPHLQATVGKHRRVRIWSAAASTGQEAYSIAMTLAEVKRRFPDLQVDILATDISEEVLAKARAGVYSQLEVQRGMPAPLMIRHFAKRADGDWEIKPEIRQAVRFQKFNLLDNPAQLGSFDVVFCRNVLIYFERSTKAAVLERLARRLDPEGFLILGGAETVIGITEVFSPLDGQRGVYRLAGAAPPAAKGVPVSAPALSAAG